MAARGRKPIQITSVILQDEIRKLERSQPDGKFANRSALWAALEATDFAKQCEPRPLTGQVAMVLAKHSNLDIQTPIGKRGREPGQGPVNVGPRKEKTIDPLHEKALKASVSPQYHGTVRKALKGNRQALAKLQCLQCVCEQRREIALCTLLNCSNWSQRPYKHKESLTEDGRKRIHLGLLDEKEKDDEPDSTGTVV